MENITKNKDYMIMHEDILYFRPGSMQGPVKLHLAGTSFCDGSYRIERTPSIVTVFEAVESGHGTLEVEGVRCHPGAGDVYIAPGWKAHQYYSSGDDPWRKTWLNVSGPLVENLLKVYQIHETYHFRNAEEASTLIREGVAALKHVPEPELERFVSELVFKIVRALGELNGMEKVHSLSGPAEQIRHYLLRHLEKPMPSLQDIADAIGRSPVQTIRIFRQATGSTPYDFLLEEKIAAAGEMLLHTTKTSKEIAYMLGFQDEFYFARLFRKRRGLSPRNYRNRGKGV